MNAQIAKAKSLRVVGALTLLVITVFSSSMAHADWTDDYNSLLKKYATPQGVKYKAWKANASDVAKLHSVTNAIAKQAPSGDTNAKLAFHLNAYNAWMLRAVIDNYPMKSIRDVKTFFFKRYDIVVSGKKISFNNLEHDIIRKKYNEPRIHFALNCASESCPPLAAKAFDGKTLDRALDKLTIDFINSSRGVKVSGGDVKLSKLFDWYKKDFGNVTNYINKYRRGKINGSISFQSYDWSLNEAR